MRLRRATKVQICGGCSTDKTSPVSGCLPARRRLNAEVGAVLPRQVAAKPLTFFSE
jgi:hypothetical protein